MTDPITEARHAVDKAIAVYGLAEVDVAMIDAVAPEVAVEAAKLLRAAIDAYALACVEEAESAAGDYINDIEPGDAECIDGECGFCTAFQDLRARIGQGQSPGE